MKFATKLTILLLAIVILISIVISYFVYTSNLKTLEEEIKDRLENQAFYTMDKIDRVLYERYADIQMMASDPIISSRNSTPKQITERLIECRNTYKTYASLSFFDLNRIRISDTAGMHLGRQLHMVRYWEDVLEDKVSAASDVRVSEELKIPCIYFASPVKDKNGEVFGVVVARMPAAKLYDITKETAGIHTPEEDLGIDLVNRDGLLLYSNYNRKRILKDKLSDWEVIKRSMRGEKIGSLIGYNPISKEEDIFVFVREQGYLDFKGNDWTLLVHIPTKIVFAPAVELRNRVVAILLPIIAFSILIALFFSRTISRPIIKLKDAAAEIGKGKLDTKIDIKSRDEIGDLAKSFSRMTEDLSKSRDELLSAKEYTDNMIKSMIDTLIVVDPDGKIKTINPATVEVLGYKEDELIGKPVATIFAAAEEEEEEVTPFKGTRMKKLIEEGSIRDYDLTYKTNSGEKIPVSFSGSVMKDKEGELVGIVGIARDMREIKRLMQKEKGLAAAEATADAEKKRAEGLEKAQQASLNIMEDLDRRREELDDAIKELRETQAKLIQAGKMAAMGTLGAGIAHQLNQPLAGIRGFTQTILMQIDKKNSFHEDLKKIEEQTGHMGEIIGNIRGFARAAEFKKEPIDINEPIEKALQLFSEQIKLHGVRLVKNLDPNLPKVNADVNQMQQVFVNFITNAREALDELPKEANKELVITTRKATSDEKGATTEGTDKEFVEVTFQDTGLGISDEIKDRIFEPFFTTKGPHSTGLGLSLNYGMTQDHGGTIDFESQKGKGAKFIVRLPVPKSNK